MICLLRRMIAILRFISLATSLLEPIASEKLIIVCSLGDSRKYCCNNEYHFAVSLLATPKSNVLDGISLR